MKRSVFVAVFLMCFFYANNVLAVDNYAVFKDVEFHLKGDYEAYSKHFNERDINSYNGNRTVDSDGNAAWRPEGTHVQTDERESWLEHELRLYPRVVFNENLEFNMRMDAGDYIFSSDYGNYVADVDDSSIHDNEKLRVEEAFVQMITPVGLFVAGRFEGGNHGIVWGIQLPQLPEWTFAVAWNKKNEERHDYETPTYDYMAPETQQLDYLDRDDQNEFRFVTIYEDKDMGFRSQQWLDLRWGASKSSAKNMRIYLPQWEMEYNKDNLHLFGQFGMGFGTLAELTKMSLATDINELQGQATLLSSELQSRHLSFPSIVVKDLGPEDGKSIVFDAFCIYDIGTISPEVGVGYTTGADHYNQINAFWWDDLNPHGYRTPRRIKTLLIGEVEDKYYPILATLATREAFDQDDVCLQNMTWLKAGATWRFAEKWKLFGQGFAAWRTNTTYFERDYWDMFPLMYALNTMTDTQVNMVFKNNNTTYYQSVDNFLGYELDANLTYTLIEGLDISLLAAYFSPGDFYKDVLTPKPYKALQVDLGTTGSAGDLGPVKGPYRGADLFDLSNAWTVQLKLDFKWDAQLF